MTVDLHTHILPAVDDGPQTVEEALGILFAEKQQGITQIVLTPHFIMSEIDIQSFIKQRNTSFALLLEKIKETDELKDMSFRLGAEVRYDPHLVTVDFRSLCIEGTNYLLLEPLWSYPFNFEHTIATMLDNGVTPVLAHIERFDYLVNDKKLLKKLKDDGVLFQCNASSLFIKPYLKNFKKLLRRGFVDILASDTHDTELRPPLLAQALDQLNKDSRRLIQNASDILV